jgi:hypothetical protein
MEASLRIEGGRLSDIFPLFARPPLRDVAACGRRLSLFGAGPARFWAGAAAKKFAKKI